jgi:hypothetical protein
VEALLLSGRQTLTSRYWTDSLEITDADVEYFFGVMLERERPLTSRDMVDLLIARRVKAEEDTWRKRLAAGTLFQPQETYEVGQTLVFSTLDFAAGKVVGTRPGSNPEFGDFTVLQVDLEDGEHREFASGLEAEHPLNYDADAPVIQQVLPEVDADQIRVRYGRRINRLIQQRLSTEDDIAYAAGQWFLKSLLPTIDQGHINLAEAVLDMNEGGPVSPEEILPILDLPKEILPELQAFALNYALYHDKRFDEVGAAGLVRWYLHRMEPEEVQQVPARLLYDPIYYDPDLLSDESLDLEEEIADELSEFEEPDEMPDEVTLTLIYPHRRSGTLPLSPELSAMFPVAREAARILITFEDPEAGEEYEGWVVRDGDYVVGLDRFYRMHKLPVGAFVRITRTDDPGRFIVRFDGYRPRTEWVRLVIPQNGRITFENSQRSIGAAYDDLMVLGADDLDAIDEIWQRARKHKRGLVEIVRELLPELARLNPQSAVHVKTLYSAVNVVRRCPPGPILAALETQPEFQAVGGHYWRYEPQR